MRPSSSNYLVVDPIFGDRLQRLPGIESAWVADTPINGPSVRALWRERGGHNGVRVFRISETESAEDCAHRVVRVIADSLSSTLRVIGASLSERLRSRYSEFGFVHFDEMEDGFVAYKHRPA